MLLSRQDVKDCQLEMEEAGFPNLARANQIHPFSRKSQMVDVEVKSYKD